MIARICVLIAVAITLTATTAAAQPPAGVDLVPTNAFAFATIKVSDLWDSEQLKPARDAFGKDEFKVFQESEKVIGVTPAEIDRLTLFWPMNTGVDTPFVVVTTRKSFNEAKVLKALQAMPITAMPWRAEPFDRLAVPPATKSFPLKEDKIPFPKSADSDKKQDPCASQDDKPAAEDSVANDLYYLRHNRPFEMMYLVDERTIVFMPSEDRGAAGFAVVVAHLLKKKANGPLANALNESAKHMIVAAIKVPATETFEFTMPPDFVPFRSLFKAKVVALTADLGPSAKLNATLTFPDAIAAKRAEPVLKTLIQTVEEQLAKARKAQPADAEYAAVFLPLLELATKSLNKAEVKADGVTVVASVEAEIGPAVAKAVAAAPQVINAAAARTRTLNNLKQIGLAIHNYHDVHNHMPMDIVDATGKPILSWRVQILPYLEQDNLYRSLDLAKSWDDPVNKRFLETMPDVFRVHGRDIKVKGMTYLQMPSADKPNRGEPFGNPFKVPGVKRHLATITDGTSNTLMVVEAEDPVLWMKPDDVKYDPKNLPKLGAPDRSSFLALFGDGSVRSFQRKSLNEATLRAYITVDGGEVINFDR